MTGVLTCFNGCSPIGAVTTATADVVDEVDEVEDLVDVKSAICSNIIIQTGAKKAHWRMKSNRMQTETSAQNKPIS